MSTGSVKIGQGQFQGLMLGNQPIHNLTLHTFLKADNTSFIHEKKVGGVFRIRNSGIRVSIPTVITSLVNWRGKSSLAIKKELTVLINPTFSLKASQNLRRS